MGYAYHYMFDRQANCNITYLGVNGGALGIERLDWLEMGLVAACLASRAGSISWGKLLGLSLPF